MDLGSGQALMVPGTSTPKYDVSNWDDVLDCFEADYSKFGVIDAVISNVGIPRLESVDTEIGEVWQAESIRSRDSQALPTEVPSCSATRRGEGRFPDGRWGTVVLLPI